MSELTIRSLCTGYGGLDDAVRAVLGGRVVDYSDIDPGPIALMTHHHPGLPNLGDIKAINWFGLDRTDILTGGYPCQPFSNAGLRMGTDDPRHIWPWIARGVGVLRPALVVLENVASHLRRGFDVVLADLAELGYDVTWTVVRASDVGAPHERRRLFIVARAQEQGPAPLAEGFGRGPRWDGPARAEAEQPEPVLAGAVAADAARDGRHEGWAESARQLGGSDVALGRVSAERWGQYAAAVARWERVRGVKAPDPTQVGARGGQVLAPAFVEWMMGLSPGWVTSVPGLARPAQLKLLGNGVVPQQAEHALRGLLPRLMEVAP